MKYNRITFPGNKVSRILYKSLGKKINLITSNVYEENYSEANKIKFTINKEIVNESPFIRSLFEDLEVYENFVSVFLHGSWADETIKQFSDIDDFVIIDDISVDEDRLEKIVYILNKIDMKFCRIDPLQHHGHWIVSRSELKNYNDSFIPIFILNDAKRILGKGVINVEINSATTHSGLHDNIIRTANNIEKLSYMMFNSSINAYKLKALIGSIALMPAMIFQLKGYKVDKREAILRSNELFNPENNRLILWATDCRNNWSAIVNSFRFKLFSLMPHLIFNPHLWRKIANKFSPKVQENQFQNLSNQQYDEEMLRGYLKEVRNYVK